MQIKNERTSVRSQSIDYNRVLELGRELLIALGEDPEREGLLETPRRWASWWEEFIDYDPGTTETTFETVTLGQMVVVSGIRVYSICEHHLLPFWCDIAIGYIVQDRVLGLSKFARIAQEHAHKLQLQERLVHDIGEDIARVVNTQDVIVLGKGNHMCMQMRGVKMESSTVSVVTKGLFADDHEKRSEFFQLVTTLFPNQDKSV